MSNESEKSIEQYLQQRAKAVGWLCFKFVSPNNRGVPDRIVILPDGETVYIEVKRMTGTLSALQQRMIKKIRYKKNPHQKEFHNDLTTKFLHLSTGFGGGKTHALCMKMIQLSMLNRPYHGGLMGQSFKDLKRDVIEVMADILEANNIVAKHHKTEHYYQFPWSKGKLFLFSAENKLRGPNLAYMLFNEATLIDTVRYKEGVGRVRQKGARVLQIASVGTPEGVDNHMYERFVDQPMRNSRIIYGDTRDNIENLDAGYVESLEDSYDKIMLDAYLRGQWVNMNGNQFYYGYSRDINEDKTLTQQDGLTVHCFIDFNVQYMTATLWHRIGDALVGFDEVMIENNGDTQKMCDLLKSKGYHEDITIMYPDPAGKARSTNGKPDHTILRDNGYEVKAKSAAPRMRERQLNTNNLLSKGRVKFNPTTMVTFRRDLQAVVQNPDTLEKVKKNEKLTHASDGFDYGCDILFPMSGKRNKSGVITYR